MKQPSQLKSSPNITYRNEADELRGALESTQRWWWEYLRLSKDYWWVCQQWTSPNIVDIFQCPICCCSN